MATPTKPTDTERAIAEQFMIDLHPGVVPVALRLPALAGAAAKAVDAFLSNATPDRVAAYVAEIERADISEILRRALLEHAASAMADAKARAAENAELVKAQAAKYAADAAAVLKALRVRKADLDRLATVNPRARDAIASRSVAQATAAADPEIADKIEKDLSGGVSAWSWILDQFALVGATYDPHPMVGWRVPTDATAMRKVRTRALAMLASQLQGTTHLYPGYGFSALHRDWNEADAQHELDESGTHADPFGLRISAKQMEEAQSVYVPKSKPTNGWKASTARAETVKRSQVPAE